MPIFESIEERRLAIFVCSGSEGQLNLVDFKIFYSLFSTCRLHNVNPEKWLMHFFENANGTPKDKLHLLLPQNYAVVPNQQ
ncbi:transposase domain-containing protein [Arachidicoccus soli]|uniref:Transposase domain-containing protein n=1 Tax=Arachidicoccus soli TaxID=2341117 RepID=A0A386HTV5_9BACT|nr:transposase domain-containing protein [Arachidicoccus soli]